MGRGCTGEAGAGAGPHSPRVRAGHCCLLPGVVTGPACGRCPPHAGPSPVSPSPFRPCEIFWHLPLVCREDSAAKHGNKMTQTLVWSVFLLNRPRPLHSIWQRGRQSHALQSCGHAGTMAITFLWPMRKALVPPPYVEGHTLGQALHGVALASKHFGRGGGEKTRT